MSLPAGSAQRPQLGRWVVALGSCTGNWSSARQLTPVLSLGCNQGGKVDTPASGDGGSAHRRASLPHGGVCAARCRQGAARSLQTNRWLLQGELLPGYSNILGGGGHFPRSGAPGLPWRGKAGTW